MSNIKTRQQANSFSDNGLKQKTTPPFHGGGRDSNSLGGILLPSPKSQLLKGSRVKIQSSTKKGKSTSKCKSATQVRHFISVAEAAHQLGVSARTVLRWCESGRLPAMNQPYGNKTTYLIPQNALSLVSPTLQTFSQTNTPPNALSVLRSAVKENLKQLSSPSKRKQTTIKSHKDYIPAWEDAMRSGLMNGKPFSERTIQEYVRYANKFFQAAKVLSPETLKKAVYAIPVINPEVRCKMYRAMSCLGKFLIDQQALDKHFVEEIKAFAPKPNPSPKRETVPQEGYEALKRVCKSELERLILELVIQTGIRASEAVHLRWRDVIRGEQKAIIIRHGKGNKERVVGMTVALKRALIRYRQSLPQKPRKKDFVLQNKKGQQMTRHSIGRRIKRLGERASIYASPHALRRSFATLNANNNRSIAILQKALGHTSIKTTQLYLQTSGQDVINEMASW